jgi:transposase-like protein
MVQLVRAGGDLGDPAREFEPTSQSIRNWLSQAERGAGRREKAEVLRLGEGDVLIRRSLPLT